VDRDQMKTRTKAFALDVIRAVGTLPRSHTAQILGRQLLRSATSVAANYRAACLARSTADFVSKLGVVAEEADESQYWIELLMESQTLDSSSAARLMNEAGEITSIVVASIGTTRKHNPSLQLSPGCLKNPPVRMRIRGGGCRIPPGQEGL
jgi:four helix bundle protein